MKIHLDQPQYRKRQEPEANIYQYLQYIYVSKRFFINPNNWLDLPTVL